MFIAILFCRFRHGRGRMRAKAIRIYRWSHGSGKAICHPQRTVSQISPFSFMFSDRYIRLQRGILSVYFDQRNSNLISKVGVTFFILFQVISGATYTDRGKAGRSSSWSCSGNNYNTFNPLFFVIILHTLSPWFYNSVTSFTDSSSFIFVLYQCK